MLKIFNFCTSTTSGIHTIMCSLETSMSSVDNDNDNDNVIIKLTSVDCSSVQLSHVSTVSCEKRANTLNAASFTSPTTYAVTHRHFTGCVCVCAWSQISDVVIARKSHFTTPTSLRFPVITIMASLTTLLRIKNVFPQCCNLKSSNVTEYRTPSNFSAYQRIQSQSVHKSQE